MGKANSSVEKLKNKIKSRQKTCKDVPPNGHKNYQQMHKKLLSLSRHQNQSKPRRDTSTFIRTATIKKPSYGKCLQGGGRKGVLKHLARESLDQWFSTCES